MSREKLQQLLKAVGTGPTEEAEPIEAAEYDWCASHYFNNEQLVKLNHFAEMAASAMAQQFSKFSRTEFNVTVASISLHYVNDFLSKLCETEQKDYYIPFDSGTEPMCGLVGVPEQVALNWARQLLGDDESENDQSRDLSQLEETLFLDLVSALVDVFSGLNETFNFHTAKSLVKGQWPLGTEGSEELCKISFDVKNAGSEKGSEAYFLILSRELGPVAGKAAEDTAGFSDEDISKAMLAHLEKMPVLITGRLASAVLAFDEIMNLQVNDILLLDKRVDEPAELIVDGRTIYYGCPAKSEGMYAVAITNTTAAFGDTDEDIN